MRFLINLLILLFITIGSCNTKIENDYVIIQLIQDGKKIADYYYNKSSELIKINEYSINGDLENVLQFKYARGKLDIVSLKSETKLKKDDWSTNYYLNIESFSDILKQKGIKIDVPFMLSNEISDIQNIISNIESFDKQNINGQTNYRAKALKLNVRFYPSPIERFIPQNTQINYFEYTVNNDGFLMNEVIKFDQGALTIKYYYNQQKIEKIIYSLRYNDGTVLESTKMYKLLRL